MVDTRDIRYINIQCKLHSQLQDSIPQITFILFSPVQLTGDLVLYIIIGRSSCIGSGMCGLNYHNHLIIYSNCPLKKLEPPNFYSFCGGGGMMQYFKILQMDCIVTNSGTQEIHGSGVLVLVMD